MHKQNVILFMEDQQTSFVLSSYGGNVYKTPKIDALAARGPVLEDAYCPYPLCASSHFSMMSGRLPSRGGAYNKGAEFIAATPMFAHYLRSNGYYTCISGKMHFDGPDQFHGFEEWLSTEIFPADMFWTPDAVFRNHRSEEERAYTFRVSIIDTVREAGPVARSMRIDYDENVIHHAVRELSTPARGTDDRPFMMAVSRTHAHEPYVITREIWDPYSIGAIDDPMVADNPIEKRDARRHCGMISSADALFGGPMQAFHDSGFADSMVVLFASDYGEPFGERGKWLNKPYINPAIQEPLILAFPVHEPGRIAESVSVLDIFPTLLVIGATASDAIGTPLGGRNLMPAPSAEHPGFHITIAEKNTNYVHREDAFAEVEQCG